MSTGVVEPRVAQFAADAEAVAAGQQYIQHDAVVFDSDRPVQGVVAVIHHIDGVAFFFQAALQKRGDLTFIFDDE